MSASPSVFLPYSIEGFFSADDVRLILQSIDEYKASNPGRLQAGAMGYSIHDDGGPSVSETVRMYEPAGRIEINHFFMPRAIVDIAERAFFQHIENIRRAYPEAHSAHGFTYVEYTLGQYFTPHIDGLIEGQVAGFGVTLTDDFEGGEFIVQTCGSNRLWTTDGEISGKDASSELYKSIPKTEWSTRPKRGNAIFYGGALTHGSKPVTKGHLKKLLGFIH